MTEGRGFYRRDSGEKKQRRGRIVYLIQNQFTVDTEDEGVTEERHTTEQMLGSEFRTPVNNCFSVSVNNCFSVFLCSDFPLVPIPFRILTV